MYKIKAIRINHPKKIWLTSIDYLNKDICIEVIYYLFITYSQNAFIVIAGNYLCYTEYFSIQMPCICYLLIELHQKIIF